MASNARIIPIRTPSPQGCGDSALTDKYGGRGPRYTSYPTADRFVEAFDETAYRHWLGHRRVGGIGRPLGLYVHVPFCDTLCFYCACNKIAAKDRAKSVKYVDHLLREVELVAEALQGPRAVSRMHWGGGTPTFLPEAECERLVAGLREAFDFEEGGEYAIEIDPRRAGPARIAHLASLGFNRMSLGVQDFDPEVQRAVNRIQGVAETLAVIEAARLHGFRSINLDLILGLPRQTPERFARTLDIVVDAAPDRIALYSYAHLPALFAPQRRIVESELPSPETKLELMRHAVERLERAGYVHIGMDHFARPDDELAVAQRQGRLIRDFQGYSASGECDLIGLGVSSIGRVGPAYVQNAKELDGYYAALDAGHLPVWRGVELGRDDLARRAVIQALACQFAVAKESIEIAYLLDFDDYFAREMQELAVLEEDGLVVIEDGWIHVTPAGRPMVRAVCMVFDRYLRHAQERARYSRVM